MGIIDWFFVSKFRSLSVVSNEMFGFWKTELKLIFSKAFSIKLFMLKISAIDHVACTVSLICKVEGLNM